MKKEVSKKYMLIFEPNYESSQYIIHFNGDKQETIRIKKYTDIAQDKGVIVKKNLLSDIDRIVAPSTSLFDLFDKYVDKKIFAYSGYNLHKIFIGYMYNNYMNSLNIYYNNQELSSDLANVEQDKVNNYEMINKMMELILSNEEFYSFIKNSSFNKTSKLSNYTLELINKLKFCQRSLDSIGYMGDSELNNELEYLKRSLMNKLCYYRDYREMFVLKQKYEINSKNKEIKSKDDPEPKKTVLNDESAGTYERLTLFDYVNSMENESQSKVLKKKL